MTEKRDNGEGTVREPIGPVVDREDASLGLGRFANKEAVPLPNVLYLENARAGGEITILRDRLSELRDIVAEAGNDAVLSMEDYCMLRVLGELFARGSISTSALAANVPKRYLPKKLPDEDRDAFMERQAAAREAVKAAYRAAFEFIRTPGVTEEGAAAMQAEVERRRDIFDREIRAAGGVPDGDLPDGQTPPDSSGSDQLS